MSCANIEGPDKPANSLALICALLIRQYIVLYPFIRPLCPTIYPTLSIYSPSLFVNISSVIHLFALCSSIYPTLSIFSPSLFVNTSYVIHLFALFVRQYIHWFRKRAANAEIGLRICSCPHMALCPFLALSTIYFLPDVLKRQPLSRPYTDIR